MWCLFFFFLPLLRWLSVKSIKFVLTAGAKQGGVVTPSLLGLRRSRSTCGGVHSAAASRDDLSPGLHGSRDFYLFFCCEKTTFAGVLRAPLPPLPFSTRGALVQGGEGAGTSSLEYTGVSV